MFQVCLKSIFNWLCCCLCCTYWRKKQTFGDFQDVYRDVTLMANSFNLRRGGLSMCPGEETRCSEELQMRAAPNAHRLALLYREKQASKLQKRELLLSLHSSWLWRNINQMLKFSFETLCPVDKNHLSHLICTLSLKGPNLRWVWCLKFYGPLTNWL